MPENDLQHKGSQWSSAPWLPAVVLIFVQIASGMRDQPQMAFILIYLQEQLSLTPVAISSVVAGAQIAGMLMALLGGAIAGRLGSKWVIVGGLVLLGVSSLAFQVHALGWVVILWLIGGAGLAAVTVGGSSYLTRISERGGLGMLAAFYALSITIGGAVGNPLAGVMIERYGFVTFSWAAITLSVVIILVATCLMVNPQNRAAQPVSLRSFWSGVWSITRQTNVRMLIGLRSLPTIFYGMLTVHIPLLLNELSGSKLMVGTYVTTNLIVASAAQLLAGRAADRWGARIPTSIAYTAMIISGLGLAASAGTVWGLFVFGVLGIAAAWALSTLMYVWINDGVPKAEHPATFGLLHAIWSLSMISGSLLGGSLVSPLMPGLPFLMAGLLIFIALFLILAYYRRLNVLKMI